MLGFTVRTVDRTWVMGRGKPMQSEETTWQIAETLVRESGDAAPARASKRARALLINGDVDGVVEWVRVMVACRTILGGAGATLDGAP
jgi:hypothetical protein